MISLKCCFKYSFTHPLYCRRTDRSNRYTQMVKNSVLVLMLEAHWTTSTFNPQVLRVVECCSVVSVYLFWSWYHLNSLASIAGALLAFSAGESRKRSHLSTKQREGLVRVRGTSDVSCERLPERPWQVDAHPFEIWSNKWMCRKDMCQKGKGCLWSNHSQVKIKIFNRRRCWHQK